MEKSISRIYNKFGKTPFTTAIAYELNDIDKNVYKLLEIVKIIECEQNIKYNLNHNIENIFILMVYIYHSNKILFNLPSMLDNVTLHDNKPTSHILYSESVSQLVSIGLMSETFIIFNELFKSLSFSDNNSKSKFFKIFLDDSDYKNPTIFVHNTKHELNKFYNNFVNSILKKTIKLSLLCYYENIELEYNKYYKKIIFINNINESILYK